MDWRHIKKRWATLIRRDQGINVFGVVLTVEILKRFVRIRWTETDISETDLVQLFWPEDAQNVSRATRLLKLIASLLELDENNPDQIPPDLKMYFGAVLFLANMFDHALNAYFDPTLDGTQQLVSLSVAATLSMCMAEKGGTAFAPSQVAFDFGCAAMSGIRTAYRLKLEFPDLPFNLFEDGSDMCEKVFSGVRTACGNNPNVNVGSLGQRLGAGARLASIHDELPQLRKPSPRRDFATSAIRGKGVDIITSKDVKVPRRSGDIAGIDDVMWDAWVIVKNVFERAGSCGDSFKFDLGDGFSQEFSGSSTWIQPGGRGIMNFDEIMKNLDETTELAPTPRPAHLSSSTAPPSSDSSPQASEDSADPPASTISASHSSSDTCDSSQPNPILARFPELAGPGGGLDASEEMELMLQEEGGDVPDSTTLETPPIVRPRVVVPSFLSSTVKPPLALDRPYPPYQRPRPRKDYMIGPVAGSAACKAILGEKQGGSKDRLERVQAINKYNNVVLLNERDLKNRRIEAEGETVETGDVFAALLSSGKVRALAICILSDIDLGKTGKRSKVPISELDKPTTFLRSQILAHQVETSAVDPSSSSPAQSSIDSSLSSQLVSVFKLSSWVKTNGLVKVPGRSAVFSGLKKLECAEGLEMVLEMNVEEGNDLLDKVIKAAEEAGQVGEVNMEKGRIGFPYRNIDGTSSRYHLVFELSTAHHVHHPRLQINHASSRRDHLQPFRSDGRIAQLAAAWSRTSFSIDTSPFIFLCTLYPKLKSPQLSID